MTDIRKEPQVTIEVQVQPRSSRDEVLGLQNGRIKVRVTAPPEGGRANERLREVIARELGVPKSRVEIVRGETSRLKTVRISGLGRDEYDSFMRRLSG